jgi:hypothetical protein
MACSDDSEWIKARIAKTKELIEAYEDAILQLSTGAQSYHLDTGQTRQVVTKAQLSQLRNALNGLENRLATLQARLCGGHVHVMPGY